jgi:hypothetical protein
MSMPVVAKGVSATFRSLNAPVTDNPMAPESTAIAATRPIIVVFEFIEFIEVV